MHARQLKKAGEKDERIWGVGAWRESPYFSNAERAALALAECVTRLADRRDAVPDAIWDDAADHYDQKSSRHCCCQSRRSTSGTGSTPRPGSQWALPGETA